MARSYKTAFPSKYLKAEDLGTTRPIGTIESVDFEEVGSGTNTDRKLVVHFEEATLKPLVLNRINSETIAEIVSSDDFDQWAGHAIQLYAAKTEFQGKRVPCIRVCAPPTAPKAASKGARPKRVEPSEQEAEVAF